MDENQIESKLLQANSRKKLFLITAFILVVVSLLGSFLLIESQQSAPPENEHLEAIYFSVEPNFKKHFIEAGQPRLMELGVMFVLRDQQAVEVLNMHIPRIKSAVSLLLSDQPFTSLKGLAGRELLKEKILFATQNIMQEEIGQPSIEKVLFTSYTLQ